MIVLTSPKDNTVQLILGDADAAWQKAAGIRPKKGLVNMPVAYRGSIFEHIESLPEGELYSAADFNFPEAINFCSKDFHLAESFNIKLIHKAEPIGHISFHTFTKGIFKNIDISLCRNFANQMTVSLINILSNEAILEREKQKTFEIKINNAVLKNDLFEDVLKEVTGSINRAVGCDICYIRIRSEEIDVKPFNLFCEKKGDDYIIKSREGILKEMVVKHADIEKNINDFFAMLELPLILTGSALEEKQNQFNYLRAFKNTFNIQSFAFIPLQVKGKAKVQLIIGSKRPFAYIDSDLEMINQVTPQLSLTLDSRLAFVQIQKLKEMLETENLYLQEEINDNYNFNEIVGNSEALKTVFSQASMVAGTDTTVLIGGETGTGKELIARAIHNLSARKDKIMVKVNCACLPAQLIESELFGHEKGAFTGAIDKRIGKFELANGGTIFLDEIGELPLELQSKLLRVIQEREFERIGGRTTLKTDIRIIAATNKNLETESNEKRFRSDLYYRLNVFPIVIPALKERKEDIPLLALHFAKKIGQRMRKNITAITNEALQEMMLYDWPCNIREMEHVVEHSVISSKSSNISLARPLITTKTSSV
ncbi:MAG: sigma 54-interacting transcriptional regulator, partial [Rhizobacter sp.]|nr:sigma 54-interacting transcriptional regulator [Ferruginibacter sp.]